MTTSGHKKQLFIGIVLVASGSIAALLGVLGTLTGLVHSFDAVARSPAAPRPSQLAEGISAAMWYTVIGIAAAAALTVLGLALAIPAAVALGRRPHETPGDNPSVRGPSP